MRQGAQGWCTGMSLKDDGEGAGRGVQDGQHVHPWLIHSLLIWQKSLQYFEVISLQLNFLEKKI